MIEADEYDTAFFDKRSKFVHYRPRTAVLNNLEFDHADIFPDLAAIETPVPPPRAHRAGAAGRLVVNARERGAAARARARLLERGGALRRAQGGARRAARARRAACLRRAARQPEDRRASSGRCSASTTSSTRWPRSRAAEHAGVAPDVAAAGARAASRTCSAAWSCAARPAASRSTTTSRTTRPRSAPPSTGCAAASARGAHPGGVRAALQHHEARRDEGAAAVGARGGRPVVLPQRRPGLGRRARRWRRWASRRVVADTIDTLVAARRRGRAPGRPRAVHEQRRLRRHPRQAARRAARSRAGLDAMAARRHPPALPARLPLVAAVVQGARMVAPGCSAPAATCTGGARSCRPRRARRWTLVDGGIAALAARAHGRHRQLARRLLRHRGGRAHRLPRGAAEPGRRAGARPRRATSASRPPATTRTSTSTSSAEYVDELRALTPPRHHAPAALPRRDRQGRRGARLARDERALRRRAHAAARGRRPRAVGLRRSTCPARSCASSALG